MPADRRFAVLIDADNVSDKYIKIILDEVSTQGVANYKRIYGNWTSPTMASWKNVLLDYSVTPIQQYSYTTGKNATDSAMIIDAMDILYTGQVDGFVLVSSDSDFTRLAVRLREAGKKVYGMGERKTPNPFIVACDKFVYIEVIRAAAEQAQAEEEKSKNQKPQKKKEAPAQNQEGERKVPKAVVKLIAESVDTIADEDGFAALGELGNLLVKKQPDFDPRNFGFSKLSKLVKSLPRFEVDVRPTSQPNVTHILVRDKQSK